VPSWWGRHARRVTDAADAVFSLMYMTLLCTDGFLALMVAPQGSFEQPQLVGLSSGSPVRYLETGAAMALGGLVLVSLTPAKLPWTSLVLAVAETYWLAMSLALQPMDSRTRASFVVLSLCVFGLLLALCWQREVQRRLAWFFSDQAAAKQFLLDTLIHSTRRAFDAASAAAGSAVNGHTGRRLHRGNRSHRDRMSPHPARTSPAAALSPGGIPFPRDINDEEERVDVDGAAGVGPRVYHEHGYGMSTDAANGNVEDVHDAFTGADTGRSDQGILMTPHFAAAGRHRALDLRSDYNLLHRTEFLASIRDAITELSIGTAHTHRPAPASASTAHSLAGPTLSADSPAGEGPQRLHRVHASPASEGPVDAGIRRGSVDATAATKSTRDMRRFSLLAVAQAVHSGTSPLSPHNHMVAQGQHGLGDGEGMPDFCRDESGLPRGGSLEAAYTLASETMKWMCYNPKNAFADIYSPYSIDNTDLDLSTVLSRIGFLCCCRSHLKRNEEDELAYQGDQSASTESGRDAGAISSTSKSLRHRRRDHASASYDEVAEEADRAQQSLRRARDIIDASLRMPDEPVTGPVISLTFEAAADVMRRIIDAERGLRAAISHAGYAHYRLMQSIKPSCLRRICCLSRCRRKGSVAPHRRFASGFGNSSMGSSDDDGETIVSAISSPRFGSIRNVPENAAGVALDEVTRQWVNSELSRKQTRLVRNMPLSAAIHPLESFVVQDGSLITKAENDDATAHVPVSFTRARTHTHAPPMENVGSVSLHKGTTTRDVGQSHLAANTSNQMDLDKAMSVQPAGNPAVSVIPTAMEPADEGARVVTVAESDSNSVADDESAADALPVRFLPRSAYVPASQKPATTRTLAANLLTGPNPPALSAPVNITADATESQDSPSVLPSDPASSAEAAPGYYKNPKAFAAAGVVHLDDTEELNVKLGKVAMLRSAAKMKGLTSVASSYALHSSSGHLPMHHSTGGNTTSLSHRTASGRPLDEFEDADGIQEGDYSLVDRLRIVTQWDFDVFEFARNCEGRPLAFIAFELFSRFSFLSTLGISDAVFTAFVNRIERDYVYDPRRPNAYHTNVHAADVAQAVGHFLTVPRVGDILDQYDAFAVIIAAIIHDFRHPGVNNTYLVKNSDPIAVRYNDDSVLENFHSAEAFAVMQQPRYNVLSSLTKEQKLAARYTIIKCVLATDLSRGGTYVNGFKNRSCLTMGETDEDKLLIMQMMLKCADVSHPARELEVHEEWSRLIMEEFYSQGDQERQLGVPISPLCDRNDHNLAKSQIGFIEFVVRPSLSLFSDFCSVTLWMKRLEANLEHWKALSKVTQSSNKLAMTGVPLAPFSAQDLVPQRLMRTATMLPSMTAASSSQRLITTDNHRKIASLALVPDAELGIVESVEVDDSDTEDSFPAGRVPRRASHGSAKSGGSEHRSVTPTPPVVIPVSSGAQN
jgi:hypothetical protein